ncbi:MAG: hypothetical protein A2V66_01810 [Ignavibacteria bacterium RBG_13_36_8]|nr:MAG: hypothetical protein A2V66_01810 [Ignavibacteria bacterium RBG_13_36_8]
MDIKDFTDQQLKDELKRREMVIDRPEPKPITISGHNKFIAACEAYIKDIEEKHPEPEKQYVFEAAMEAVYGEKIWEWVNSNS